ncbi:MAG TPA: cupin domain-containing protein [Thermoplasmata archaeon]|nr:cupin domain-containing protein [Thermoplasmata archaeon]
MVEGNGSSIILYRLEPGRRFEDHDHPFPELGVVLAGRGRMRIGEEERALREGDAVYVPGGIRHGFRVDGGTPVVMMNVTVPVLPDLAGPPFSEVVRLAEKVARSHLDPSSTSDG